MIRFIRTTKSREFSKEAESFWHGETQAGFVCHMVDSKNAKTLDEVIESCHAYNKQWGDELFPRDRVAYDLLRLLEFGMVGLVLNDKKFIGE